MKHTTNRAAVILIAVALLFCAVIPAGCKANEEADTAAIEEVSQQFIEAFGTGDTEKVDELVDGDFEYKYVTDYTSEEVAEILIKIASKTEITSIERIRINKEAKTAKAMLKLSYIDVYEFKSSLTTNNLTLDDYLEEVDAYKDRQKMTLTMNFVYDEDEGQWLVKKASADKYMDKFNSPYYLNVVEMTADDAAKVIEDFFLNLADGELDQSICTLYPEDFSFIINEYEDDPAVDEAKIEFIKAYFGYMADNGITVTNEAYDYEYDFDVCGYVPSSEAILDYLASDEAMTELYMADIRSYFGLQDDYTIWTSYYSGIYYDLAKKIPDMPSEYYSIRVFYDPWYTEGNLSIYGDSMIQVSPDMVFWTGMATDEQSLAYCESAAQSLMLAGEITQDQYDEYVGQMTEAITEPATGYYGGDAYAVTWEGLDGYPNQAVNVVEEMPDWSDGSLIYGTSEPDANGICMHYSKQPTWLNTAGYYMDSDYLYVLLKYDRSFDEGTILEYDWDIDGEAYIADETFVVEEDGQSTFVFSIPASEMQKYSIVEFRLWEEGHDHVIAYVKLTQT